MSYSGKPSQKALLSDWNWETELRALHERLGKAFVPAAAAEPAAAAPKPNGKKPAPKTAVVPSTSTGGGASAPKKPSEMTPSEWAAYKRAKDSGVVVTLPVEPVVCRLVTSLPPCAPMSWPVRRL